MSLARRMHVARIGMRTILFSLVIYLYCREIRATCIRLAKDIHDPVLSSQDGNYTCINLLDV